MKKIEIQKQLNFIPNELGIPIYDDTGKKIRKGIRAWQNALDQGVNLDPTDEHFTNVNTPEKLSIYKETLPKREGQMMTLRKAKSHKV